MKMDNREHKDSLENQQMRSDVVDARINNNLTAARVVGWLNAGKRGSLGAYKSVTRIRAT
jgi:hypothetical protein